MAGKKARGNRGGRWAGLLLSAAAAIAAPAWAQAAPAGLCVAPSCDEITLEAQDAACTPSGCRLTTGARISCGALVLRADSLQLRLTPDGQFGGADASGDVILDDGLRRLRSSHIELQADRVSAQLQGGLLQLRRTEAPAGQAADSAFVGPCALTVTGDLARDAQGNVEASKSTLTLCDCGPNTRPSWQLYAPRVQVRLDGAQRATVYWPQLRINLLGQKLVPITPPLLPISLPLGPRAFGLLVPQVTFLGPPWPTIDVPVFVPLGPAWDVTVTPGVRMDWRYAPRLGLRLRGAPAPGHSLALQLHVTADLRHGAARRLRALTLAAQPHLALDPGFMALLRQREALVWRSRLDVRHHWQLWAPPALRPGATAQPALNWHSDATWVSDDAVLADLGVATAQRVATYLPSRTALALAHPTGMLTGGIDAMVRLDTTVLQADGSRRAHLSNWGGPEGRTLHRAPWAQLQLWSRPWRRHLRLQGQLSAVRYGPFGRGQADAQAPPAGTTAGAATQSGARLVVGAVWGRTLGPVRSRLALQGDAVSFVTQGTGALTDGVVVADGELSLPLWRTYGAQQHLVVPSVRYRGLVRLSGSPAPWAQANDDGFDPYLERAPVQQLLASVRQSLGRGPTAATLELGQPIDLRQRAWLPQSGRLTLALGQALRSETLVGAHVARGRQRLQHLAQQLQLTLGPWGLRAHYLRAAPSAERFVRTVYELSGTARDRADVGRAAWAHTLSVSGFVDFSWGLHVGYGTTLALPKPDAPRPTPAVNSSLWRTYTTAQSLDVSYTSPCTCWGIAATVSASPQALWRTFRMQVLLTLADTRVGY